MKEKRAAIRSTCGLCQIGCGVRVSMEGGQVARVEGDPDHPLNKGVLCSKGLASLEYLNHKDRLRYPLKRIGKRGEGKWETIGWEEAFSLIAANLSENKTKYGPESVVFIRGAAKGLQDDYLSRFANAFGSPNITSMAHVCFIPRRTASVLTYGFYAIPDLDHPPRAILVWGNNVSDTLHHVYHRIRKAQQRGAKLMVVDPLKQRIAGEADRWVRIRPGSDLAFALGLLHVIIDESLYDREFVDLYTTGFEKLKDHVTAYTPERVSALTDISPEAIIDAARFYGGQRPACMQWGNGIDHGINNVQTARALCILRAITGNIGVPGGDLEWSPPPLLERGSRRLMLQDRISPESRSRRITGDTKMLPTLFYALPQQVVDAILTGVPYPVRAAYIQGCNPLLTYPNAGKVFQALKRIDFLAVSDMFMTPTAFLADVVLPVTTYLEFDSIVTAPYSFPVASVQQKVTRIAECRSDYEIMQGLAEKMGLGEDFQSTEEGMLDLILKPVGISFQEFRQVAVLKGSKQYRHEEKGFPTPSRKVELYSERLAEWGFDPLPVYRENAKKHYPYLFTTCKVDPFRHSGGRQIASLRKRCPEPVALIHPETAKKFGLEDGDRVSIETPKGKIIQRVRKEESLQPEVIGVDYGWWLPEEGEASLFGWDRANVNILTDDEPPYSREMGTPELRGIPCRIEKAR